MALGEFELIARFFDRAEYRAFPHVRVGIGDDCAILRLGPGEELCTSIDTVVCGVHFPETIAPADLAWRALAAAASDLAGCGARPLGCCLALTLPESDEHWLAEFGEGLYAAATAMRTPLVGGDTTRGPLTLSVQVFGATLPEDALLRSTAVVGDRIWVTGTLGDARAALHYLDGDSAETEFFRKRYYRPRPPLDFAEQLPGLARAAIDISDGLAADLGHILAGSGVGAEIELKQLPLSPALLQHFDEDTARDFALHGGDDYELCFTAPPDLDSELQRLARRCDIRLTAIGKITAQTGLRGDGEMIGAGGYTHF